jgi:hypothetical protein
VSVRGGALRAALSVDFHIWEFQRFREQLGPLTSVLHGSAKFEGIEPNLLLELHGDGRGHVTARGEARDTYSEFGDRLVFGFNLDQTYLPGILRSVDAVLAAYAT